MPTATVTVRELKNKDTGLDITIPTHRDIPALLGVTTEYHIVVVSRLHYFKSPKHKETDVVQFMIPKKFSDFEHLHAQLTEQFPATILPPLPKKALRVSDTLAKERKSKLENFLKFLACTSKLSTCSRLLEFLGVNAIKAGRYRKEGQTGDELKEDESGKKEQKTEDTEEGSPESDMASDTNLFGEEEEEGEVNMFEEGSAGDDGENMFPAVSGSSRAGDPVEAMMFAKQDFGGGLREEEGEDLLNLIPEARIPPGQPQSGSNPIDLEDNSDLLKIEDDLDKFLTLEVSKKKEPETDVVISSEPTAGPSDGKPVKPPKPGGKPSLKPKPGQRPVLEPKPKISQKPVIASKPSTQAQNTTERSDSEGELTSAGGDNSIIPDISDDDILQYIQQNASSGKEDLDLFS